MSKISEFIPNPESVVVAKILVHLHKAIDQHFPNATAQEKKFSRTVTVFGGEAERTAIDRAPDELLAEAHAQVSKSSIDSQLENTVFPEPNQFGEINQTTRIDIRRDWHIKSLWVILVVGLLILSVLLLQGFSG